MPELPEVQTTVSGLQSVLPKLSFISLWTDWPKMFRGTGIKAVQAAILHKKIIRVERRAKNILIHFEGDHTLLIHMKMTGHLLYGYYKEHLKTWVPHEHEKNEALRDPYNRFIHVLFSLSNGKHLAFCDTRKFGKLALIETSKLATSPHLSHLGPEPLSPTFTFKVFNECLAKKAKSKIKTVLMDQTILAGIGNIYSDEVLWLSGIHPEQRVSEISPLHLKALFQSIKPTLRGGIAFGGDSTSDYRNIYGEPGKFQNKHHAYRKTGKPCERRGCKGIILRKVVGGRSAHFCSLHQPLRK
jgi:formamidopyrimidine-DNA glycosylase